MGLRGVEGRVVRGAMAMVRACGLGVFYEKGFYWHLALAPVSYTHLTLPTKA